MTSAARGIRWMLLAMFLFACLDAGSKILAQTYAAQQILAVRFTLFLALVVMLMGPRRATAALRSKRPWLQVVRVGVLICEMAVFVAAVRLLPLGDVHAVAASTPLIVTALAGPLLREEVGLRRWIACLVGMAGLLVVVRPGLNTSTAMLVPLLGAFLWATYQILVRIVSRFDEPDTTLIYTALVGFAVMGVTAPFVWTAPSLTDWALLLFVALFGASAHVCLIKALESAPASVVQPFTYTLTVWAVLLGYLVFGDVPDAFTILGGAIIVASGLFVWATERSDRG